MMDLSLIHSTFASQGRPELSTFLKGFTASLDTQHVNAFDAVKAFLNAEIFGPGGPKKVWRREFRPAHIRACRSVYMVWLTALYYVQL